MQDNLNEDICFLCEPNVINEEHICDKCMDRLLNGLDKDIKENYF